MCFSPQADLVGGIVIGVIGLDIARHVGNRRDHLALAALPLLFAGHQLTETLVWWGLQGHVASGVGHVATWLYLLFAFVVLPVYLPSAVLAIEPPGTRRRIMTAFVVLGAVVSSLLLVGMLRGPVTATLEQHHIAYSTGLRAGGVVVALYVAATCGALLFSGFRSLAIFGIVNLVAVGVLAHATVTGFASLWCGWAAVASAVFALHFRFAAPRPQLADRVG